MKCRKKLFNFTPNQNKQFNTQYSNFDLIKFVSFNGVILILELFLFLQINSSEIKKKNERLLR